jgi:hypothetical protein
MRRGRSLTAVLAAAAVAFAILWGAADSLRPFATFEREVVQSTPGLGALDSRYTLALEPGDEACIDPVTLTPGSQVARFRVLAPKDRPAPPLEITARAGSYRSSGTAEGYPTGGDVLVTAELDPPERELRGSVCARNAGETPVELVGAQDIRSLVPADLLFNGDPIEGKDLELTLLERERRSIAERPGELIEHAQALGADFAPTWLLWVIAVLVLVGVPVVVVAGYFLAVRSDADDAASVD